MSNKNTKYKFTIVFFIIGFILANISMISINESTVNHDSVEIYKLKKEFISHKVNIKTNLKYKIIHGSTSIKDIDQDFERKLVKFGYEKSIYHLETLNEIIQTLNSIGNGIAPFNTSCLPTYRYIIIYKKNDKITKIVKICTSCFKNEVITKNERTELLLFIADYEILEKMFEK
ncbi:MULTISPECIES: hypothetical protein [Chryseobacterium]|uniref:Uncharacterized protein n=1 Tax=Chryseobacterium taihuense TaxID=1141221 RepID=A0A4U8WDA2_9FLAO|nr:MULTISPECIES: hypothetical protein [Chryseobacterium]QQV03792.1 hypothetical protein I6I61_05500 [Chryseobacterium sp. FDAARGOS 1104]VFB02865.1 Uncharacterised protein [Chryseobacterium taihuense]